MNQNQQMNNQAPLPGFVYGHEDDFDVNEDVSFDEEEDEDELDEQDEENLDQQDIYDQAKEDLRNPVRQRNVPRYDRIKKETSPNSKVSNSERSTSCSFCTMLKWLITLILIIGLVGAMVVRQGPFPYLNSSPEDIPEQPWIRFNSRYGQLVEKYDKLVPSKGWNVIKASLQDVLNSSQSREPSVIFIIGKQEDKNVACFVKDLHRAVSTSFNEKTAPVIDGSTMTPESLTRTIEKAFGENEHHVIVIDGVDKLNGKSALRLHRYTDHESSIYKQAVIILVAYSDNVEKLHEHSNLVDMDKLATGILEKKLIQSINEDEISGLVSRFTPSVTAVLHTSKKTVC